MGQDIYAFDSNATYCFVLSTGEKLQGKVYAVYKNGIRISQFLSFIPQQHLVYWYEIEE